VIAGPAILQVMTGRLGRLTYACMDTLIPFGMIGYLVTLTNPSPRFARYRWFLLPMFALFVVICAYRSHIVICALATVIVLWRRHPAILVRALGGCAALVAVACWFAGDAIWAVWGNVWARFQGSDSDGLGTRAWEIQYAWEQFLASPIWGQGLGHQIPIDVVHDLSDSLSAHLEEDSVGYMHNVWMYMLMDLGLTGMLSYLFAFASPMCGAWRAMKRRGRYEDLQFCLFLTLGLMLLYTSCQAAFRLIQFNVVLGWLLAAFSVPRPAEGARS
jgi:O-antigen ligase